MMTARKLIESVVAEPFRPFRLNMASGQAYAVRHPENIAVSKTSARVFSPRDDADASERWHDVSLLLIESVEPIESRAAQNGS